MEKTKAQQLVEIASWVKAQNPEFTKHFKAMKAILKVYKELPADYDKKKSVVAYINKGMKSEDVALKQRAEHLGLVFNALFGFRYFTDAPFRYLLHLGLKRWTDRKGEVFMEVRLERYDRCNPLDDFHSSHYGSITTRIKSLGDAKRAVESLLEDVTTRSDDYEVEYGVNLLEAMKQDVPTDESLTVGHEIRI